MTVVLVATKLLGLCGLCGIIKRAFGKPGKTSHLMIYLDPGIDMSCFLNLVANFSLDFESQCFG